MALGNKLNLFAKSKLKHWNPFHCSTVKPSSQLLKAWHAVRKSLEDADPPLLRNPALFRTFLKKNDCVMVNLNFSVTCTRQAETYHV